MILDGGGDGREYRHDGNDVAARDGVAGKAFVLIFQDDPQGRLGAVGPGDVRHAHPREQEAEGYQEGYQYLWAEIAGARDHRLSSIAQALINNIILRKMKCPWFGPAINFPRGSLPKLSSRFKLRFLIFNRSYPQESISAVSEIFFSLLRLA